MRLSAQWQWSGQGIEQAGECRVVVGILGEDAITVAEGTTTTRITPSPIPETFRTPPLLPDPDDDGDEVYDSDATVGNVRPAVGAIGFFVWSISSLFHFATVVALFFCSLRICGHFGRGVRGLSTTPRLRTFCWAVLMGILLLPSPPQPWPATHRLPFRPMPIPQPRAIPRIAIIPAQSPSDTSRSSSGSNVATLVPVQPCASADRASTCRKPLTAEPEVDVARQRIRELVLDHFLQTHAPVECNMGALVSISTLRVELRDILWLIDHLLDETPCDQSLRISEALWREVRSSLKGLLVGI
ncbi:hypothetical protein J6590_078373 [Homalodisca vitripennis]|nr:hypothetical protein J6590_078373 [Homalodisca vitripennis]